MSIVPIRGTVQQAEVSGSVPVQLQEWEETVSEVSIFAEEGQNGKSSFSILLKLGQLPDPSTRQRRTVRVTGLTLGVEDKEIPVLARLAGRRIGLFIEQPSSSVQKEDLEQEIRMLRTEVQKLQEKNRALSENLHHLVEQSFKAS